MSSDPDDRILTAIDSLLGDDEMTIGDSGIGETPGQVFVQGSYRGSTIYASFSDIQLDDEEVLLQTLREIKQKAGC